MGIYSEYLDKQFSFPDLSQERKVQLRRIAELRGGRDILVFAADLSKGQAAISITYSDLLPISDQLANLSGNALDLILETPGGSGEVAEDIVKLLRNQYDDIAVIVPGVAKSAGTIMAMAADEILMEPVSALGPIDAQLTSQGKTFSAEALLEGMEKIKREVDATGTLNRAYIPILQSLSPGELQTAENAQTFAKVLVTDWLLRYKFKSWSQHSGTGQPVTEEEKRTRAEEIATLLCDHSHWLTHGRSIKLEDFAAMRLLVTDYSKMPDLADAIRRYHTLLQITFATNIYKVIETPESQIYRFTGPAAAPQQQKVANVAIMDVNCSNCKKVSHVQANFESGTPLQQGNEPYPADNKFHCPDCGTEHDLSDARRQVEAQAKKRIITQ